MTAVRSHNGKAGGTPTLVFRHVTFTLPAFDRLKEYQRHFERTEGRSLTNGEVLDRLILTNPQP